MSNQLQQNWAGCARAAKAGALSSASVLTRMHPALLLKGKVKITIEADEEHVAILLGCIEGMMSGDGRSMDRLAEAVDDAARRWRENDDDDFGYQVVKIAPVYAQLLRHAGSKWGTDEGTGILYAENVADFVLALRAAREVVGPEREVEVRRG